MKTGQAQYETAIERPGKQLAERDTRLLLWMAAMLGMFTAILGLLVPALHATWTHSRSGGIGPAGGPGPAHLFGARPGALRTAPG